MTTREKIEKAIADGVGADLSTNIIAHHVLAALLDPSDEAMLAPGPPYQTTKTIKVSIAEGVELRRKAWNKIVTHIMSEG